MIPANSNGVSLVGSRKERRREEKEIEGGGFILLISFKEKRDLKQIWQNVSNC